MISNKILPEWMANDILSLGIYLTEEHIRDSFESQGQHFSFSERAVIIEFLRSAFPVNWDSNHKDAVLKELDETYNNG